MRLSRRSLIPVAIVALGCLCLVAPGCTRTRDVEKDLKLTDVSTGWYDVGVVNGQNKIVPSITLQLENISKELDKHNEKLRGLVAEGLRPAISTELTEKLAISLKNERESEDH